MAAKTSKQRTHIPENHPINRKFKTVEEAAQAMNDYLFNVVLRDVD